MSARCFATSTGPRSWLARQWRAFELRLIIRWAESDREELARQLVMIPKRLRTMDRDLEALRVEQALLLVSR